MTLSHHAPRRSGAVEDRQAGPNQRFKDLLDAEIDAKLLRNWPTETADTARPQKGARP
ncbi:hypothetical protein [Streptomyces cinereospinus]|uniref:Transposase n=1 Tax=Streptomyces cinereospinus TaxID=285561 RepID=A0ABV5N548_9ACTN